MMHPLCAVLAVCTAAAVAQTPACVGVNDTNTISSGAITQFGFGGQNSFAWQYTPTTTQLIQAAQVFTENALLTGDRFMAVEIWDDVNGQPGSRQAGGAWKINNSRPTGWQGANLDSLVILQQNVPIWFVWVEPGFSRPIIEPGGSTVLPAQGRAGTGSWTSTSASAPKFRLFCNYLDDANSSWQGVGCALSSGTMPTVHNVEQPMLGNADFCFEINGCPPGGAVFVALGGNPGFNSMPITGFPSGCDQHTDAFASLLLFAGTGDTRGPDFSGYAPLEFAIPSNSAFAGTFLAVQAIPLDLGATAPLPFGTSNAQRVTLF
ncbi:MAG: hypothetical protein NXI31_08400 [bacterium]|nr:hypothetical protein [bacterium]